MDLGLGKEVVTGWEKYQMSSFNALFSSRNINRVIKNDRRWAGHVARIGRRDMHTGFVGKS
jgi:hypothetical protein